MLEGIEPRNLLSRCDANKREKEKGLLGYLLFQVSFTTISVGLFRVKIAIGSCALSVRSLLLTSVPQTLAKS